MEFLNPAALYAFFLVPLLLIPYLIRRRPRRLIFSSLLLLRGYPFRSLGRPWGRLRLPPIFFLQLLLLLLLILALADPILSVRPASVAIVLDNSASMQALEGRKSRFEVAQEEVADLLRGLPAGAKIDLYLTVPKIERIGDESLSATDASLLIAKLRPSDLGEAQTNYGEELLRLARDKSYERLYFLTDHPARGQGKTIRAVPVGRPGDNLAITSFHVSRPSFLAAQLSARVEVTSFSSKEEKAKLLLKGEGRVLAARPLTLAPRATVAADFDGFPSYPHYEADLEIEDGLLLDNRRFALPPPLRGFEILAISPRPEALYGLRSIAGLNLNVVSPETYQESGGEAHALEIFHYATPSVLPQKHALFILPPKHNPLVDVGKSLSYPVISGWRESHPLTRYVNFALFRPAYARALKPLSYGDEVIQASEGPLVVAMERKGFRYVALGFDPFPYLGRENLPVSIFTLNLLSWFHEGVVGSQLATGAPLHLGRQHEGSILLDPSGQKFEIQNPPALFSRTYLQGLYRLVRGKEQELIAVNLQDVKESDLGNPTPIDLREEVGLAGSREVLFALWPYLILLSVLLLIMEWFVSPAVTRS